jgi:putative PIN family toxin of toxin-antitoxin system
MTNRPRYVLDTNVIVSALLFPDSHPGRSFFEARKRGDILLSDDVVKEITDVLRRPKFDRYVLPGERDRFIAKLVRESTLLKPTETIRACRDLKDDKWLELAVEGNSTCLVTGDDDLLALDGFRGITITTPAVFLRSLAQ